ncbi:hypothetical protein BKA61DRAFT_570981 [Leptodontidium sp. MPI-SDFR-AT-0119]|nr:hypothetical protein BKA61DRAFT_570981 [Leptodontidium sp. MPI-SDFR-AT-0119]
MHSSTLTLALLSVTSFALAQEKRQATDEAQFASAASAVIASYIPATVLPGLESAVSSAAAAASITGDAKSLLYSALLAESAPAWLGSAIPAEYSSQFAALEGTIEVLRPSATGASPGGLIIPVIIPVTTTDSSGNTITTSVTSLSTPTGVQAAASTYSTLTTQVVDGVTSVFSTVVTGVASVASEISSGGSSVASHISTGVTGVVGTISSGGSSVASHISTGVTGVAGTISSGGSSVASHISTGVTGVAGTISAGGSSVASEASTAITGVIGGASSILNGGTSSSTAGGSVPTGVSGAAAGVIVYGLYWYCGVFKFLAMD